MQEAFEVLKARLEEQEEEKLWTFVDFVATVCKGKGGVGFGMSVMVDTKTAHIVAKVSEDIWHMQFLPPYCTCTAEIL